MSTILRRYLLMNVSKRYVIDAIDIISQHHRRHEAFCRGMVFDADYTADGLVSSVLLGPYYMHYRYFKRRNGDEVFVEKH